MKVDSHIPVILGIIILSSFFVIQADAQPIVEASEILRTGIIPTAFENFEISTDFHVRVLGDTEMRISGTTTEGNPFYIFEELVGDELNIRGTIVDGGKVIPFYYQINLVEEESQPESDSSQENAEEIFLSVTQPHNTRTGREYVMTARVTDSAGIPIQGASIDVTFTQQAIEKEFAKFNGETDQNGFFEGRHLIQRNLVPPGQYDVTVVASYGPSSVSEQLHTFIFERNRR